MKSRLGRKRGKERQKKNDQDQNRAHDQNKDQEQVQDETGSQHTLEYDYVKDLKELAISKSLERNERILKDLFADCSDIVMRKFQIQDNGHAIAVFVDGLVDSQQINETLKALMILEGGLSDIDKLKDQALPVSQIQSSEHYDELLLSVLAGDVGILIEGESLALMLGIRGFQLRSVSEPETESVVRGPREGFIENIRTNTSLIRRRLKTPYLKMSSLTVGKQSNTSVVVAYMENIADPATVQEIMDRINRIEIDAILETGTIEQLIEDNVYSPFPQFQYTERPDTVVASLLEGRIAILVDGTPFALLAPTTFWMLMQASEDYYERAPIGTMIRWIRYLFLVISLITPAFYVAITTYHIDFLPTSLLLSIAAAREAIPFPAVVETLIMEITFEALREAGIRLPKAVGQTVSILGALVVGSAAVEAGIVSAPIVIVVSITGIASFTIPRFNGAIAIRMLRFPLIIAAGVLGLFGILVFAMIIIGHMVALRSVGVPYMAPAAPMSFTGMKDVLFRPFIYQMSTRPAFLSPQNSRLIGKDFERYIGRNQGQKGESNESEADKSKER